MPPRPGKEKAAPDRSVWVNGHPRKITKKPRPPPAVVQAKNDSQLLEMSPRGLVHFKNTCKQAEEKVDQILERKRAGGLASFGFQSTQQGARRSQRLTDKHMSEVDIANDDRSPASRIADRRVSPRLCKTPEVEARGLTKVNLISPASYCRAGPSVPWCLLTLLSFKETARCRRLALSLYFPSLAPAYPPPEPTPFQV